MQHSIIAMSAAGIWGKPGGCTAYPMMAAAYPDAGETEESRDGDAAHEVGAAMIMSASVANLNFPKPEDFIGKPASNGVIITEEMFEAAEIYAENVAEVMRAEGVFGGDCFGVEQKVEAPQVHDLSYGTTDCFIYAKRSARLYIWDFKFGHEYVNEFENWQSINYAAGLFQKLGIDGIADQRVTVHIRIVQPRVYGKGGPIREWVVRASDLRGYVNRLHAGAAESLGPNPVARTGKHCKNCSARHACEPALRAGVSLYEAATAPTPVDMSPEALAVQYAIIKRARKQLEYLESGYDEQIKQLIKSGKTLPGFRLEQTKGRKKWKVPLAEVFKLGELMGVDLRKDAAVTPNQAQKAGLDDAVINAYCETPTTGVSVVPDDGSKARFVFSK